MGDKPKMEASQAFGPLRLDMEKKRSRVNQLLKSVIPDKENMSKVEQAARYALDLPGDIKSLRTAIETAEYHTIDLDIDSMKKTLQDLEEGRIKPEDVSLQRASRARPILTMLLAQNYESPYHNIDKLALATECMHSASLILDDMPNMDDDKIRRWRPATHLAFADENRTANMASHRLANACYELIATYGPVPFKDTLVIEASRVGNIMLNAQEVDLDQSATTEDELRKMYIGKSGELLALAARLGTFHEDGTTPLETPYRWTKQVAYNFGRQLGFVYQLADDLKDIYLTPDQMGKDAGQDEHKQTFIHLLPTPEAALHRLVQEKEKAKRYVKGKPQLETLVDMLIKIPEFP